MLHYIWAGLIAFSLVFALIADGCDDAKGLPVGYGPASTRALQLARGAAAMNPSCVTSPLGRVAASAAGEGGARTTSSSHCRYSGSSFGRPVTPPSPEGEGGRVSGVGASRELTRP